MPITTLTTMKICQPIRDSFARALLLVGLGMAVLILSPVAHGQTDIYLKNGVLDPTIAANWTLIGGANATVVNASDLGIINSTVTGVENLTTFAGSLTLGGLEITNPGGAVSLSPSSATTFNLGSSALLSSPTYFSALPFSTIDLSNSSVSLTLGANLNTVLTSGQNWYVGNGTSTPTLTVSGTLALGTNQLYMVGTGNYDITGAISGSGQLVVDTNGTTTLSGLNTNSGGVVLGNGTLVITNNGTGSASSLGTGNFSIGTDYLSGTGNISTNNTSVILGTNNQILLGGNLNFAAGAGANLNFGTGAVILLGNETANISGNSVTINGNIVDGGAATSDGYGLTKTGAGTLVLGGSNSTFTGNLNLTAGVLSINNSLALQNAILNITGGSFTGNVSSVTLGGLAGNQIINIGADAFTIDTVYGHNATYTGNIADSSNAATVSINGAAIQAFSGNNMINGTVTLNSGTLGINNGGNATSSAIGTGTLVIAGGSLDNTSGSAVTLATNNAQTWNNSYSFAGTNNLNMGTGAVTLNEAATTVTVNSGILTEGGNISGTGDSITKAGT
jgi:autotransporter-associated beta strand protein